MQSILNVPKSENHSLRNTIIAASLISFLKLISPDQGMAETYQLRVDYSKGGTIKEDNLVVEYTPTVRNFVPRIEHGVEKNSQYLQCSTNLTISNPEGKAAPFRYTTGQAPLHFSGTINPPEKGLEEQLTISSVINTFLEQDCPTPIIQTPPFRTIQHTTTPYRVIPQ